MTIPTRRSWSASLLLLVAAPLAGCGDAPPGDAPDADVAPRAGLDACGDAGLALAPLWEVDNLHGAIVAMAVAPGGAVLLATADGAVKQWDVGASADAAPLPGGRPSYGEPLAPPGATVAALAVHDDAGAAGVLGGDAAGRLRRWALPAATELDAMPLGAEPVVAIAPAGPGAAVVADARFAGGLRVVSLADGAATDPFPTALWGVTSIVRAGSALYTAGHDYGMAAIERRDAAAPAAVVDAWDSLAEPGTILAVAVSPDGARVATAGDGHAFVLDAADLAAGPRARIDGVVARAVAFTPSGAHVALATDDGRVALWTADLGAEVGVAAVPSPVAVAVDPSGDRLIVASADGRLRALACR